MIIDENKLRKISEKLVGRGKGTMPSLKFHKGKSARSDTLEAVRLGNRYLCGCRNAFWDGGARLDSRYGSRERCRYA